MLLRLRLVLNGNWSLLWSWTGRRQGSNRKHRTKEGCMDWGREERKRLFSLCLGNTCSLSLRERGALFTCVYTNDSELGPIWGEEQMALRAQEEWAYQSHWPHMREWVKPDAVRLDKCLGEPSNIFGSANPKTHVTKGLLYLPVF